jgi:hypothetical protein
MKRSGYKGDWPFVAATYGWVELLSFGFRTQTGFKPSPDETIANFSVPGERDGKKAWRCN